LPGLSLCGRRLGSPAHLEHGGGVMRTFKGLRGAVLAGCLAIGLLAAMASGALAAGMKVCVPAKEGAAVVTAKAGVCGTGYTKTTMLPEAEQEDIQQLLP
jgi:hypothetical protein